MARQKIAGQVETLRRQQTEITAKLKEAENRDKESKKALKEQRYMIAGAVALALVEENPKGEFAAAFRSGLAAMVKKSADRALFDLPPPEGKKTAE